MSDSLVCKKIKSMKIAGLLMIFIGLIGLIICLQENKVIKQSKKEYSRRLMVTKPIKKDGGWFKKHKGCKLKKHNRSKQQLGCKPLKGYSMNEITTTQQKLKTLAKKVDLTEAASKDGAVCTDGSTPAIYWRKASNRMGKRKFMIYFNGGGWCAGINTEVADCWENCFDRATLEEFGTSKFYNDFVDANYGQLSPNKTINPTTYNWNLVIIPLCDSTSYAGNLDKPIISNDGTPLYFRGWRILNGVFKLLENKYNFKKATDVIIGGCSAGALNLYMHLDYIQYTYVNKPIKKLNKRNKYYNKRRYKQKKNFMGIFDSGFFPKNNNAKFVDGMNWIYYNTNVTRQTLNKKCFDNNKDNPNDCMFAETLSPYIKSKALMFQSQYDGYTIGCVWGIDIDLPGFDSNEITYLGRNLTNTIEKKFLNKNINKLAYIDSCERHCDDGDYRGLIIQRFTEQKAQFTWYKNAPLPIYKRLKNGKLIFKAPKNGKLLYQNKPFPCDNCCPIEEFEEML